MSCVCVRHRFDMQHARSKILAGRPSFPLGNSAAQTSQNPENTFDRRRPPLDVGAFAQPGDTSSVQVIDATLQIHLAAQDLGGKPARHSSARVHSQTIPEASRKHTV